ncbi:MAG: cell division ATP-binding protein FtsE [Candidatus Binatia bacterium]
MIQLLHVSKTYPPNYRALTDINLEIPAGEFVFIVGASGAGKSTLLKLLFREEEPSAGQILIAGKNVARLNRRGVARLRRTIGLIFQECKLLASLTALENVALAAEALGAAPKVSRIKAYQLLRELGLRERYDAKPLALSAGERQRVAIARALINEPALVLADEPTGNLDVDTADEIMRLLLRMRDRGATVIIATHDYGIMERYGTRVISLHQGMLADHGDWLLAKGDRR